MDAQPFGTSTPGSPASPDWSGVPGDSAEGQELRQVRLAIYGRSMAFAGAFFLVANGLLGYFIVGVEPLEYLRLSRTHLHLLALGVFAVEWLLCARLRLAAAALELIDAACLLLGVSTYALMASINARGLEPALILALITMSHVVSRAVIVPGSARRALWLSSAACLPLLIATHRIALASPDAVNWGGRVWLPVASTVYVASWAVATVAISVLASRIIYGLAQKVRDAMQLGQYTLEEKIGEGGMGLVYRARHALLRRPTAIKLLPRDKAGEQSLLRFEREVQLTSQLSHPNTIAIYDYGHTPDGVFYYAMEYLDGITLAELIEHEGSQPAGRVIHVLSQLCGALEEAHGLGLIHRDVKPANVMLCVRGAQPDQVKVLDFGLVKEFRGDDANVSISSTILGTPVYLAPEAITDPGSIDHRADLYAVGALGYELLTGTTVFSGATVVEVCLKHLNQEPIAPSEYHGVEVPAELEALVLSCLRKDRTQRPQSAREIAQALAAMSSVPSWSAALARAWWTERAPGVMASAKARRGVASVSLTVPVERIQRS